MNVIHYSGYTNNVMIYIYDSELILPNFWRSFKGTDYC